MDKVLAKHFGKNLRARRITKGYTQDRLAKKVGVSKSFIEYLEGGKRAPSLDTLNKLSETLVISINQLLRVR